MTPEYTGTWKLLYDWQSLLAGVLGSFAAITVVVFTLRAEQRKTARELIAIRRSLGVEVRQFVSMAMAAHNGFKCLAQSRNTKITARMIENMVHIGQPVVYPASADKIGLLGSQAMEVVIIYNLIEVARAGTDKLLRHRTSDDIPPALVAKLADAMMLICRFAQGVLPNLKTNVRETDERDGWMSEAISNAASAWEVARKEWPELRTPTPSAAGFPNSRLSDL